ncbi:septum formation initiator family protein [Bacillus sp. HMF5848]|uniref:FtsB family cell division protein n=1 Tax=Bacillus sp. HMF5848 TaxID=2495421 RepID=UPI000F78F70A|nr:septum formation initiator family protein [Bacillus sp. HMF5848]RSK25496.1 septum formation initiator family protein [Bacillus sp. HMF5848]
MSAQRNVRMIQSQQVAAYEKEVTQQKTRRRRALKRLFVLMTFTVACVFGLISLMSSQSELMHKKNEERDKLIYELKELEKEQKSLEQEIVKLQDEEYVAKLARKEYFLSKDGEIIFNLPED